MDNIKLFVLLMFGVGFCLFFLPLITPVYEPEDDTDETGGRSLLKYWIDYFFQRLAQIWANETQTIIYRGGGGIALAGTEFALISGHYHLVPSAFSLSEFTDNILWTAVFNSTGGTLWDDTTWLANWTAFNTSWSTDTSAVTECSGALYLAGNGTCTADLLGSSDSTWLANWTAFNTSWSTDTKVNLTEDDVEAYVFDNDNTAHLNMSFYNVTSVDCILFKSGGKICSS